MKFANQDNLSSSLKAELAKIAGEETTKLVN
jgi:hypothetical protein